MIRTSIFSDRKVVCAMASENVHNLIRARELAEAGSIRSLIDRCYPLEQAAEAHRYMEGGSRTGPVVLTLR